MSHEQMKLQKGSHEHLCVLPREAHVRYQCWLGKDSDGAKEPRAESDCVLGAGSLWSFVYA